MMSEQQSYLRPSFMALIAKLLVRDSVNVIIPSMGAEADRFVADIQAYAWDKQVLVVDMAACRQHYPLFIQLLSAAYLAEVEAPKPIKDFTKFQQVLRQESRAFVLVLNHLDMMASPDVDVQFDKDFYGALNSLKNLPNVTLLTIATKPLRHGENEPFHVGGDMITSPLIIAENRPLRALSHAELAAELQRRDLDLSDRQAAQILHHCKAKSGYNYAQFVQLCDCLETLEDYPANAAAFGQFLQQHCPGVQRSWKRRIYDCGQTVNALSQVGRGVFKPLGGAIKRLIEIFKK